MGGRDWEDVPPSEKILCSFKPYISQQYLCDKFINSKTYLMMFWGEVVWNGSEVVSLRQTMDDDLRNCLLFPLHLAKTILKMKI